jgi:adenine-specific DNA-methyltransferase
MKAFASANEMSEHDARKLVKDEPERMEAFVIENAKSVIRTARPDYEGVGEAARQAIDASKAKPTEILKLARKEHSDMYFKNGERILFYVDKLKFVDGQYVAGEPLTTLWDDILSNNLHNEGGVEFPKGKKPEALIKRLIELTTSPGDIVLDSFAGSGTTGAVAHKMGRRWIMVELGEHCHTHIVPRLKMVIDGKDTSGVTEATSWKGGGGFRYFRLAPSLLEKDRWGNWVISTDYNAAMLTEAVCKLMGFTYAPSEQHYWMHGRSSETDFIYVTTQSLTYEQLKAIAEEVGDERTLLVCCKAFRSNADSFPNLTVRKIPQAVLRKCEWGKDDYSLNIANLPLIPIEDDPKREKAAKGKKSSSAQVDLFAGVRK